MRKPKLPLSDTKLYFVENTGEIACGRIHCIGVSAKFNGYNYAGANVYAVYPELRRALGEHAKCEKCGETGLDTSREKA